MSDVYPLFRGEARVVSAKDPKKLGRIQLKIFPELAEIPDNDCPWCLPVTGGVHGKSFGVPLKDQLVSCVVWNKFWSEISFFPFVVTDPTKHLFDDWLKKQRPDVADMETDPEEEHLLVNQCEDDFNTFNDTKNSQHGFSHPSKTYGVINKDGSIFLQSIKKLVFHNKNSDLKLKVDSETGDIELETKGSVKNNIKGNQETEYKGNLKETVTGTAEYKSANTDIKSTAPVGINDGLYSTGLSPYLTSETAAHTSLTAAASAAAAQLSILDAISGGAGTIIGLGAAIAAFCGAMLAADTAAHTSIAKAVK